MLKQKLFAVNLLKKFVLSIVLLFYYPLFLCGLAIIQIKIILNQLKLETGLFKQNRSLLKPLRRSKVRDIGVLSTEDELDFLTHRSCGYLERMTLWSAKELTDCILGLQTISLIPNNQLRYVLFNTSFAHFLTWDNQRNKYCLDFSDMTKMILFEGFYWEVKKVFVHISDPEILIVMNDDHEYSSIYHSSELPNFNLAKLHLQVCLSFYCPGGVFHNDAHFVFPSALIITVKRFFRKDSALYQLLSPHFRFTEAFNYQTLKVCHAQSNTRTMLDRFACFWKTFPITKEQFLSTVEDKLTNQYSKKKTNDTRYLTRSRSASRSEYPINNGFRHQSEKIQHDHPFFPPRYVTDSKLQEIPYFRFLKQYYGIVRGFVTEMSPFLNQQEYKELSKAISKHVPGFDEVNMIDGVSSFIHLVSIVHSADHKSYLNNFARKYGCMCIRTPFEAFSNKGFWRNYCFKKKVSLDFVKENPTSLISRQDVMRMRCFLNVFVDFIPSPNCELSLIKTIYEFKSFEEKVISRNFISNLRCLDGQLKTQYFSLEDDDDVESNSNFNMQLVELKDMIASNCF